MKGKGILKRKRTRNKRKKSNRLVAMLVIVLGCYVFYDHFWTQPDMNVSPVSMPEGLHPVVEERKNQLIKKAADVGIVVVITDGFRSAEEQNHLYEKGRTIGGNIVTYAKGGESYHNYGLAVDFALKTPSGDIIWDMNYDGNGNSRADWQEVVHIAKELGFEWGGDWPHFKDYPHLQMDFGLSIADLQRGKRPPDEPLFAESEH